MKATTWPESPMMKTASPVPVLQVDGLRAGYGSIEIVHDVSLHVVTGQALAIVGRNGVGKTTALRAIAGQLPLLGGRRVVQARDMSMAASFELSRAGLAFVPADRQVFKTLTVRENLMLGGHAHRSGEWNEEAVLTRLFPRLRERYRTVAGALSGGEQQMLTIARALLANPRVLLLDEPTEGLAPMVVETFVEAIQQIRDSGVALVLVEQNLMVPRRVATDYLVLDGGKAVWSGDAGQLAQRLDEVERYLTL
jgi:branched-chain amino acid transport system ATP-binding protein